MRELAERFAEKTCPEPNTGCLLWTASLDGKGYGQIAARGPHGWHPRLAHQIAWELAHGPIPAGLVVCHRCDTPPCVNVAHLFLGTMRDNTQDMLAKGRHRALLGEANARCTIGDAVVAEIVARRERGESQYHIAAALGLTRSGVKYVLDVRARRAA